MKALLKSFIRINLTAIALLIIAVLVIGDFLLFPIVAIVGWIISTLRRGTLDTLYFEMLFDGFFEEMFGKERFHGLMDAVDEIYHWI